MVFICLVYKNLNAQKPHSPQRGNNTKIVLISADVCIDSVSYENIRKEISTLRQIKHIDSTIQNSFSKELALKDSIINSQKVEIVAYQDRIQTLEKSNSKQRKRSFWQKLATPISFLTGLFLGKI